MKEKINSIIDSIYTDILNIRRHIHQYPELSFDERNTSSYIKAILDSWNISYSSIVENGIVKSIGLMKNFKPGMKVQPPSAD